MPFDEVKSPVADVLVELETNEMLVPIDVAAALPLVVTAVPAPAPTVPAMAILAAPAFDVALSEPKTVPVDARSIEAAPPTRVVTVLLSEVDVVALLVDLLAVAVFDAPMNTLTPPLAVAEPTLPATDAVAVPGPAVRESALTLESLPSVALTVPPAAVVELALVTVVRPATVDTLEPPVVDELLTFELLRTTFPAAAFRFKRAPPRPFRSMPWGTDATTPAAGIATGPVISALTAPPLAIDVVTPSTPPVPVLVVVEA